MSNKTVLVELEGISKTFTTEEVETLALSDVNLTIFENDFVVISGPSGCGKSTLLPSWQCLTLRLAEPIVLEERR